MTEVNFSLLIFWRRSVLNDSYYHFQHFPLYRVEIKRWKNKGIVSSILTLTITENKQQYIDTWANPDLRVLERYWDSSFYKLQANNMLYNVRDLNTYCRYTVTLRQKSLLKKSVSHKMNMWCFAWFGKSKKIHWAVLLPVKLQALALKVTLLRECFSRFLNCKNVPIRVKHLILPEMVFMQKWLFNQPKLKKFLEYI